jgi:serine protease AprX
MMKRFVQLCLLGLLVFSCFSGRAVQYAFLINFTDKSNTPFSLSSPSSYLSPRAIARRAAEGISTDSLDLPVSTVYVDSVLHLTGGILHETSKWGNSCVILVADSAAVHSLTTVAFVKSIRFVAFYPSSLHFREVHIGTPETFPAARTTLSDATYYGNTWTQTAALNGNYLHDAGFSGSGKLIAVLDAGFFLTDTHLGFDSLRNSGRIVDVHNFTLDTSYVYAYDSHGTSVLSTMAGYAPDTFVGAAPLASYALYVSEDDNTEQLIEPLNLLCAAERADSVGADIITCSLGYNTFDNPAWNFVFASDFDGKSTYAAMAANIAARKGILFVASAGNEGGDLWNMILTPGDADSALTIGNLYPSLTPSPNSGYGPNAAGQVKPDVCAIGQPANVFGVATNDDYAQAPGTSFSTPQIAGWAASLWQANPHATQFQIKDAIRRCASLYSAPTTQMGYGIPNFMCSDNTLTVGIIENSQRNSTCVAFPNPFSADFAVSVLPAKSGAIHLELTDARGVIVWQSSGFVMQGSSTLISVPASNVSTGVYFLKVTLPDVTPVLQLVKN